MKTPVLRTETETERVVHIPEASKPPPTVPMLIAVLAVVASMLLSGSLVYFWQQGRVHNLGVLVFDAREVAATARIEANAALAVNAQLQVEIADLQQQKKAAKQHAKIFKGKSKSS